MIGKYPVITLCGSTRFKDAFLEAQKRLILAGNIVISVDLYQLQRLGLTFNTSVSDLA